MRTARRTFVATGTVAILAAAGVTAAIAADPAPPPPPKIAFLANGIVPADALAAGPIAGQLGAPIYTTRQETLSDAAATGLDDYDPELVIVLGGPVAISDAVIDQVETATGLTETDTASPAGGIVRAAGGDRFDTAAAVADLLSAYNPAYLPINMQAIDADTLDGKHASDFLAADGKADTAGNADTAGHANTAGDADTLEGFDASSLVRAASDSEDRFSLAESGDAASVTITAPTAGALMVSASADVFTNYSSGANSDTLHCRIEVDGKDNAASNRTIRLYDAGASENDEENCATDAFVAVGQGDHTVDFEFSELTMPTLVHESTLNVLFVPFGPDGAQITP